MSDGREQAGAPVEMTDLLAPARCAVVIIDLQNDYVHEDGAVARMGQDVTAGQAIMPAVHRLVDAARAVDVPRIYVRTTHGPWTDTPAWRSRGATGHELDVDNVPLVREGTWGAELYQLSPRPDEIVVTKHRYSSFAYTALELNLCAVGRDTVVLAGTQTDICVEATATDAIMRGFHPVLAADCVATSTPERQAIGHERFVGHLGRVTSLEDIRRAWKQ